MKRVIHYNCIFQGSVEVDVPDDELADFDPQDHLDFMTNQELFAGCETTLSPELEHMETTE